MEGNIKLYLAELLCGVVTGIIGLVTRSFEKVSCSLK